MVCLGNMRFARGARATRETDNEKELDILCTLQLNRWNGNENVELIIEDILKK